MNERAMQTFRRAQRQAGRLLGLFLTGLIFILPVLLTLMAVAWVLGQLGALFGPDTILGTLLSWLGAIVTLGTLNRIFSFWLGVVIVIAGITALGVVVRTRARTVLERAIDDMLGRIPVLGAIYKPLAQLVRTVGGNTKEEMASMSVVACAFGQGAEVIALLASPDTFDVGNGPSKLVLIPTAPVPFGGALIFVPEAQVRPLPDMGFDDLAKFYLTMGTVAPAALYPGQAPAKTVPTATAADIPGPPRIAIIPRPETDPLP